MRKLRELWWLVLDRWDNSRIQRRMRQKGLIVDDPWSVRTRETLALVLVCSWRRHDRPPAFQGGFKPCRRCSR